MALYMYMLFTFLYARPQTGRIMVWWCPSLRLSVTVFRIFSYMLWHIELKICMSLSSYEHLIKFECRQFPSIFVIFWNLKYWNYTVFRSFLLHALTYWAEILPMSLFCCTTYQVWVSSISVIFVGVMPLLELRILEIHRFPHFSLTCFDILSWNFAYDFFTVLHNKFKCCHFLLELCPFWNLKYWKYTVFCIFLLRASTFCSEILHMTVFYCTTDQDWVLSISASFCRSYAPFGT